MVEESATPERPNRPTRPRGRIAAFVMIGLLAIYVIAVVQYAFILIGIGDPIPIAMGVALLVIPIIGTWVVFREIIFVVRAESLTKTMRDAGELPVDDLPRTPSGRPDAQAADAQFPQYQSAVEADPESWRPWLLLGLAYDASGDRPRARWATREAIRLERSTRASAN
ncbi:MAG: tetratricopeptide repeat protein [Microbacteriaceae bacterium]